MERIGSFEVPSIGAEAGAEAKNQLNSQEDQWQIDYKSMPAELVAKAFPAISRLSELMKAIEASKGSEQRT
jgi:hypothetical protein